MFSVFLWGGKVYTHFYTTPFSVILGLDGLLYHPFLGPIGPGKGFSLVFPRWDPAPGGQFIKVCSFGMVGLATGPRLRGWIHGIPNWVQIRHRLTGNCGSFAVCTWASAYDDSQNFNIPVPLITAPQPSRAHWGPADLCAAMGSCQPSTTSYRQGEDRQWPALKGIWAVTYGILIYITYIMLESQQQTHLGIVYSMRWWWFWGWFIFGLPTLLPLPYATNVDPGASVGVIRLHTFL